MIKVIDKSRAYTYIASVAAFLQLSLPQWQLSDISTQAISAILLSIVSVFTILKQRSSIEVRDNATTVTYMLIGVAALGGLNEVLGIVHFNDHLQGILRSIIAAIIGLINLASKNLFPTEAGKAIQQAKADIKDEGIAVIDTDILSKKK